MFVAISDLLGTISGKKATIPASLLGQLVGETITVSLEITNIFGNAEDKEISFVLTSTQSLSLELSNTEFYIDKNVAFNIPGVASYPQCDSSSTTTGTASKTCIDLGTSLSISNCIVPANSYQSFSTN